MSKHDFHCFAGANTPYGFYSLFAHIMPTAQIQNKIYIKGGSGSGKSTLMKKTAELYESKGHEIEYFHCSNDADSLDGIAIPACGVAVVDATSPHPADPLMPAAIDEIFDTAEFLNKTFIKQYKNKLLELSKEKRTLYGRAYIYLEAAQKIYKLNESLLRSVLNLSAFNAQTIEILKKLGMSASGRVAFNREFFATAITPDGLKSLMTSAIKARKTYVLKGFYDDFLEIVQKSASLFGLNTTSFMNPFEPELIEHLLIPGLDVAFVTSNKYHEFTEGDEVINFDEFSVIKHESEITRNNTFFDELLREATKLMKASMSVHFEIEEIYGKGMNFEEMNKAYNKKLYTLLMEIKE